ncbi:hypothetical protein [Halomonas chromatireducens]|uniref:Uncharacterized protein n=1 Tax=Halomonas chromatireducens TaxID=507626 RepID=A0A0X8HD09_9GAMM|nr:hypothetical protein [Halomonas chromatireducens]AMD00393.1 hypothetical protein LOKO_01325 [Halomonas chromatireducens]
MIDEKSTVALLIDDYPHLEEKAIVDFINNFSVMADHLNKKQEIADSPSARFFDWMSGRNVKRQLLLDRTFESELVFVRDYIVENEKRLVKNDDFMDEIMSGVSLLSGKLREVANETCQIKESLEELRETVCHIESSVVQRLDYQELYINALSEKELALSIFSKTNDSLSPEQSLWLMLTRLWYGDFGRWLKASGKSKSNSKVVKETLETLKNQCMLIMSKKTGRSNDALIDRDTLYKSLISDFEPVKDALCLMSDHHSNKLESMIYSLNSNVELRQFEDSDLPFVFSNISIFHEMASLLQLGEDHATTN